MPNAESFANITAGIAQTNDALSAYDAASERAAAAAEAVEALTNDVSAVRANTALSVTVRAQKFGAASNALSLSQADAVAAQTALATQKSVAVATGKAAASKLFEILALLKIARTKTISDKLVAEYDWSLVLGFRPQDLANAHQSVRAIGDLGVTQLSYELTHGDDYCLVAFRRLGQYWDELRPLAEESGLELNIAPISVPPPKPKPVVTGNVLGTLVAA